MDETTFNSWPAAQGVWTPPGIRIKQVQSPKRHHCTVIGAMGHAINGVVFTKQYEDTTNKTNL